MTIFLDFSWLWLTVLIRLSGTNLQESKVGLLKIITIASQNARIYITLDLLISLIKYRIHFLTSVTLNSSTSLIPSAFSAPFLRIS